MRNTPGEQVLKWLAHDLTNKLTCVSGFIETGNYEDALHASREAVRILGVFQQGIAVRNYELQLHRSKAMAASV